MTILLFLIILAVLVFVHELGHFVVAKLCGIRVDEFAIGFPPRLFTIKRGETNYSLNLIPFGGYVKIFGENPDEESLKGPESSRSFINKNRGFQALVLVAGVTFNILFAWFLISLGFMTGLPSSMSGDIKGHIENPKLVIRLVEPGTPAEKVGLKSGDTIMSVTSGKDVLADLTPEAMQIFVNEHLGKKIHLDYSRGKEKGSVEVTPVSGIVENRGAIGIAMDMIGLLKLPWYSALWNGLKLTAILLKEVAVGLGTFLYHILIGHADFSQVSGPVGIAGYVGDAAKLGLVYVITFTAFISLNLAVINLIPFPALDGGRLLFVLIESIKRSPIRPKIANTLNTIGFALLMLLMVVVLWHDIAKLSSVQAFFHHL